MVARSKEGAEASIEDGQFSHGKAYHHRKGQAVLGEYWDISTAGRGRSTHSNSLSIRASAVGEGGENRRQAGTPPAPRLGKGPLCMPRRGPGSHKAPIHVSRSSKIWFLLQGLKWEQRQRQSGEGRFHTAKCVFLLTIELSMPSTHPVPSGIPLSASPASVPERSTDLTVGEQTSRVGSEAL